MRFRGRKRAMVLVLAVGMLCAAGCGPKQEPGQENREEITVLTIGTADSSGTMYPVGSAIAEVLERESWKVNVGASSGSAMNVRDLLSGAVDLGLVSGDTALAAYEAEGGGGKSLRAVAAVFVSTSNWLSLADSDLHYVHELENMRLGVGPEGSGTEHSALAAMGAAGVEPGETTLENCSLGAGVELVLEGQLDAVHGFAGAPILAFSQLAEERPCRVLSYTPQELENIVAHSRVFTAVTLPAGTYPGQTEPVDTFGAKCLLCVDASMDEELVYQLTRKLWEAREELGQQHPALLSMLEEGFVQGNLPIPLHDGASRFYGELPQT